MADPNEVVRIITKNERDINILIASISELKKHIDTGHATPTIDINDILNRLQNFSRGLTRDKEEIKSGYASLESKKTDLIEYLKDLRYCCEELLNGRTEETSNYKKNKDLFDNENFEPSTGHGNFTPTKNSFNREAEEEKSVATTMERIEIGDITTLDDVIKSLRALHDIILAKGVNDNTIGQIGMLYTNVTNGIEKHRKNITAIAEGIDKSDYLVNQELKTFNLVNRRYKQIEKQVEPNQLKKIKIISTTFTQQASQISQNLRENLNVIKAKETEMRINLANTIKNIKKFTKEQIADNLTKIINAVTLEKSVITHSVQDLDNLKNLETALEAQLNSI